MLSLVLAAAAAIAAVADPQPARPTQDLYRWFTADDYPTAALVRNGQGTVRFRLTIDPQGVVSHCAVEATSGDADLDRVTCEVLRSRARYHPARDAAGQAVAGSDSGLITWRLPTTDTRPPLELTRMISRMRLEPSGGVVCTFTVNGAAVQTRPGDECGLLKNSGWDRGLRNLDPGATVTYVYTIRPIEAPPAPAADDAGYGTLLMESRARASIGPDGRTTDCRTTLSRIVTPHPGLRQPPDACAQSGFSRPGPPSSAFRFADIEVRLYLERGSAR
jgi:TonB family protein